MEIIFENSSIFNYSSFARNIGHLDTKVISNIRYDVDLIYILSLSALIIIRNIAIIYVDDPYSRFVDSVRTKYRSIRYESYFEYKIRRRFNIFFVIIGTNNNNKKYSDNEFLRSLFSYRRLCPLSSLLKSKLVKNR